MANPVLSENMYRGSMGYADDGVMTVNGTSTKTAILLGIAATTAIVTWNLTMQGNALAMPLMIGGLIVGLILALVTAFKATWSPVTAPLYAAAEGLFLGAISAAMNGVYPGIVIQAVCLTFGIMFMMLFLFRTGIVKVTDKLRAGILMATGAIMLVYLVSIVLSFFGTTIPYIHQGGLIGILFSLFVCGIASLNLLLDFDFIDRGAELGAPKYMEWYGAFGLMVTLVWLYLEILRLLAKLQSDD